MMIDPSSRSGTYNLDEALRLGMLTDARAYRSVGRPGAWYLIYEGNRVGRAVVECYGFELLALGVMNKITAVPGLEERSDSLEPLSPRRPERWRLA